MAETAGDVARVPPLVVEQHETWSAHGEITWARLDEPERVAWAAFSVIDGQFNIRETLYEKNGDPRQFAVLDGSFVAEVLDTWLGVPVWMRPRVWEGVQLLHDLRWQKGRDHPSVCWHHEHPLQLCDRTQRPGAEDRRVRCLRCGKRWRCRVCWHEGAHHVGCRG